MADEILACGAKKACFLSTPSLFFSLPTDSALRQASWVFDLDVQFGLREANYFSYDFNKPSELPSHLLGTFVRTNLLQMLPIAHQITIVAGSRRHRSTIHHEGRLGEVRCNGQALARA